MIVGLTYDLQDAYLQAGYSAEEVAELDRPDTIDAIAGAIESLGHECRRVGHAQQLMTALLAGERWDLVFNLAEGLHGFGRESLVPALLDHHRIGYAFSDPVTLGVSLHKGIAKHLLHDCGLPTPPFVVVASVDDLPAAASLRFPLFAKPVAEGTSRGIGPDSIIRRPEDLGPRCLRLLSELGQPAIVEEYLPGRELTVAVLGTGQLARALGTLEVTLRPAAEPGLYSFANKERCEELVDYTAPRASEDRVVAEAERLAVAAWRALGGRDAGRVDLRCDADGAPQLLEINPLAGLHPTHSDVPILCGLLGHSYEWLIGQIIESASHRTGPVQLVA
jgi:D-alanine-D-alanine ligase